MGLAAPLPDNDRHFLPGLVKNSNEAKSFIHGNFAKGAKRLPKILNFQWLHDRLGLLEDRVAGILDGELIDRCECLSVETEVEKVFYAC